MNIKKSYYLFFIVGAIFVGQIFFSDNESTLDFNIHDTYYVIRDTDFYYLLCVLFFALGFLYFLFEKLHFKLFSLLTNIHVYGTLIGFGLLLFCNYKSQLDIASPKPYYVSSLFDKEVDYNMHIITVFLLIIFLQFLFFINIFVSLIKNLRH